MSSADSAPVKTEKGAASSVPGGERGGGSSEYLEALMSHGGGKKQGSAFLEKLYEILMNEEYEKFICWCSDGKSILIKRVEDFSQIVLPKYYKHNNFQSFVRQLNMYNFTKTSHDANRREFKQPLFRKGKRNLLPLITRKTQKAIRSMDSSLDPDPRDAYDMATSRSARLEGQPLVRCKTVDCCTRALPSESSPLWGVVQELQMRVSALEMKLLLLSGGQHPYPQDRSEHLDPRYTHSHSPHCHQCSSSSCTCALTSTYKRKDGCSPTAKKLRLHKQQSAPLSSVVTGSKDEHMAGVSGRGARSRSISFSSYESGRSGSYESGSSSCESGSCSSSSNSGRGSYYDSGGSEGGAEGFNHQPLRAKRGVDAILSAAEILHDNAQKRQEKPPSGMNVASTNYNIRLKSPVFNSSSKRSQASSTCTEGEQESSCETRSDSSTSPLYFQDRGRNSHLSVHEAAVRMQQAKAGLPLTRSSTVS